VDDYKTIIIQALADRLAEAATEWLHEKIRREYWGYVPDENLTPAQLIAEQYTGIRPAIGYPACPDHTEKSTLWRVLDVERRIGISLTESYAMNPPASLSGLIFAHPESRYFAVGPIAEDQVRDYAERKNESLAFVQKWLLPNLREPVSLPPPTDEK
jgi:5-methyltetrahydrofolate--homocysteine methyltransferase